MRRPQFGFENFDRAVIERFGFGVIAHLAIRLGEIIQNNRDIGMLVAERFLANLERALIKRNRFGRLAHWSVQRREIVQAVGDFGMLGTVFFLTIFQDLFCNRHGLLIFARAAQLLELLHQAAHVGVVLSESGIKRKKRADQKRDINPGTIWAAGGVELFHAPSVGRTARACKQTLRVKS